MNPTVAWVLDVFDAARRRGTALDLREQRLGDGDVRDLANALRSGGVAGPIEGLNLGRNFVGDGGAEALAGLLLAGPPSPDGAGAAGAGVAPPPLLHGLQLARNLIGADGAAALAGSLLSPTCRLRHLNLSHNSIGERGATALASALEANSTLQTLRLDLNSIGDGGAAALGRALARNACLTKLVVGPNSVGPGGCAALADGIAANRALEVLSLEGNPVGDGGIRSLAGALRRNRTLAWLVVGKCGAGNGGIAALCRSMCDGGSGPSGVWDSNHSLANVYGLPRASPASAELRAELALLLRWNKAGPERARREKIARYLRSNPSVGAAIDIRLLPRLLHRVGRDCGPEALWRQVLEIPDLIAGGASAEVDAPAVDWPSWRKFRNRSEGRPWPRGGERAVRQSHDLDDLSLALKAAGRTPDQRRRDRRR